MRRARPGMLATPGRSPRGSTRHAARAMFLSGLAGACWAPHAALHAQVAPTEVQEKAVDEFGLERKTGRYAGTDIPLIGIGPEEARIGVSVTGVWVPPNAESVSRPGIYAVEINGPRLTFAPIPKTFAEIPGEIEENRKHLTVDYAGALIRLHAMSWVAYRIISRASNCCRRVTAIYLSIATAFVSYSAPTWGLSPSIPMDGGPR